MEKVAENYCFGGTQERYKHASETLNCEMHFSIYLPPQVKQKPVPILYWLSGLTCTDQNFVQKAGAQRAAAKYGVAIVAPDTSPRGENVPSDPDGHWSFGHGAGFYVDATQAPWSANYQMYSYIRDELPKIVEQNFPVTDSRAIMGHSMGGHGALILGLNNTDFYQSISAFAPICNPSASPWGVKAFSRFLGEDKKNWQRYDAMHLLLNADNPPPPIKVDQGLADEFLEDELRPQALIDVAHQKQFNIQIEQHALYDHSYFFITSFIEEHVAFHTGNLLSGG